MKWSALILPAVCLLACLPTHTGQTQDKEIKPFAAFPPAESLLAPASGDVCEAIRVVANLGEGYQDLGDGVIILGEGGEPRTEWIGRLKLSGNWDATSIIVTDEDRRPVRFEQRETDEFLILGKGQLYILATLARKEPFGFEHRQFELEIPEGEGPAPGPGPGPEPEPGPDPDVPPDEFDNIGQRVSEWTAGLGSRERIGGAFLSAAQYARTTPSATVNSVQQVLSEELSQIPEYSEQYDEFRANLSADLQQRWPLLRGVLADYYEAVSRGLGVQQ